MLSKSYWRTPGLVAASILSAAAVGALAAPSSALAKDDVAGFTVTSKLPTSLAINIAGKTRHQVFQDVRAAALVVCRNAYLNGDFGAYAEGYAWCPVRTTDVAFNRYEAILKTNPGIEVAALTIASPPARD